MRRLGAAFVLSCAACAGSGGPAITAGSFSSPAGGPASVPMAPPARRVEARAAGLKRVVLVEATGRRPEVEAFVDRFLSDVSDAELFAVADARLSGASVAALAADAGGTAARVFNEAWPGDAWLAIDLGDCHVARKRMDPEDPYRQDGEARLRERSFYTYDATCNAIVRVVDPLDGTVLVRVEARGDAQYSGDSVTGDTPSEFSAARKAATKAVKELRSELRR